MDDLVILFGHMHIDRYGIYLTCYIGRDGICHLVKIISNFFMKSICRCAQTQTHTHICCVHVSLCYTAIDFFVLSPRCTCKKNPKLTQSWVLMATKISGSFGSPQASAHGWLSSSLGPEACDRCYLLWHGFGLPNPRTFL